MESRARRASSRRSPADRERSDDGRGEAATPRLRGGVASDARRGDGDTPPPLSDPPLSLFAGDMAALSKALDRLSGMIWWGCTSGARGERLSGAAPLELVEVDGGALSELLCAPNPVAVMMPESRFILKSWK